MVDPRSSPYNAAGDCQIGFDGEISNGSHTFHSVSSAPFVAGDAGKVFFAVDSPVSALTGMTTISAFVDSSHVTLAGAAAHAGTGAYYAWATQDDTAALLAATAAASANQNKAGTVDLTDGSYLVRGRIMNIAGNNLPCNLVGEGRETTQLILRPDLVVPGDGTGALIQAGGYGATLRGFSVLGPLYNWSGFSAGQGLISLDGATEWDVDHVQLVNLGATTAGCYGWSFNNCHQLKTNQFRIQGGSNTGSQMAAARFNATSGSLVENCFSNFIGGNLWITSNATSDDAGTDGALCMFGGLVDEGGPAATSTVANGGRLRAYGTTFFGGGSTGCRVMDVDATSKVWLFGASLTPYVAAGAGGGHGLIIASGGSVRASGSVLRGANGNVTVTNNGQFFDDGGNQHGKASAGGTYSAVPWRAAFSNPNGVIRG